MTRWLSSSLIGNEQVSNVLPDNALARPKASSTGVPTENQIRRLSILVRLEYGQQHFAGNGAECRHHVSLRGHDGAKRTAAHLIREAGFNPVDLGALTAARYIEPFSLLTTQIAYRGPDGPELAYRFEHFPVSNQ
jgi:hypothetical protein